jgi:hypothetical protein
MRSERTVVLEVAYTDLVSSQVNLVSTGGTYNYAIDTPISADGSPHITHLGFQFVFNFGANNPAATSTLSNLISSIRLKVGATEIMNYDQTYAAVGAADVGQIGVLAQKVGGVDVITEYTNAAGDFCILGELGFPVGLPAGRSHRVNVQITLLDETAWCGQALVPGSSDHNLCLTYGTSTEATLYGSRQDYTLTANATRSIVIFGKEGWNMLGILSQSASANDRITEIRVRNGAFRSLTTAQWRIINGTAWRSPLRLVQSAIGGAPNWSTGQPGSLFVDLRRLTAGASAEMLVSCGGTGETHTFFPVWVAPINAKTSRAPKQTAKTVDSTTKAVLNEGTY